MPEKLCPRCGETKPLESFPIDRRRPDGRYGYCKPCKASYMRDYASRRDNFKHNLSRRCREHGITLELYERLDREQDGCCVICGGKPSGARLCFDHCHADGAFRGLLCERCNTGLGLFLDNPDALRAAAEYVERHAK